MLSAGLLTLRFVLIKNTLHLNVFFFLHLAVLHLIVQIQSKNSNFLRCYYNYNTDNVSIQIYIIMQFIPVVAKPFVTIKVFFFCFFSVTRHVKLSILINLTYPC